MPSRLLREGILDSEAVNALSFAAEVFYRRLMSVVDDFGRFDGRAAILKGRLYALKHDVTEADIAGWIGECERVGLIALYAVDHKPYLLFKKLGPARAKESKFPAPPSGIDAKPPVNTHPFTDVNKRAQAFTSVPYSYSGSSPDSGSGSSPDSDPPKPPASAGGESREGDSDSSTTVGPSVEEVVSHWNAFPGLTPAVATDPHRDRWVRDWATSSTLWVQHWRAAIAFMGRTPLYCGGGRDRWRAQLKWLFERSNFAATVEKMLAASGPASAAEAAPATGGFRDVTEFKKFHKAKEQAEKSAKEGKAA